jgi:3-methyl-2-oxobutanoate hydroxymethyltransferase
MTCFKGQFLLTATVVTPLLFASNVMHGNATTLPITVDEMIFHARAVARAAEHAFVVCDMPFGSYQISEEDGIRNAVRIMKEAGVDGVKLEGGAEIAPMVSKIVAAGIPVCGHLGLTPQSVHQFGGYGLRAKEEAEAEKLIADAKALEAAGCFSIVLEKIPANLAEKVSAIIKCPIIGIGAGNKCGSGCRVGLRCDFHGGVLLAFLSSGISHYTLHHETLCGLGCCLGRCEQ